MNIDFNKALEQLAEAFNTTVEHLYPILIKQAYVAGTQTVIIFLVLATMTYLVARNALKEKKEDEGYWQWTDEGISYMVILSILGLFTLIGFIIMMSVAPTAFINPEYWAIKEILTTISPK